MPEALAEIQAAERFCHEWSEHFTMQGAGIHRYDVTAGRYLLAYSSEGASELLAEVERRLLADGEIYDLFISHASEDKGALVRPLAESLRDLGLSVWYDEFELRPGDSLRESLDRGIATSKHGLVVLSPAFIQKRWTQWELNGIVSRLMNGDAKLLPMWHNIDREMVTSFSPSIADLIAIVTTDKMTGELALEIVSSLDNLRDDSRYTPPKSGSVS